MISNIGWVKRRQGKYQECIEYILRAFEVDPLSNTVTFTLGETYALLRDYETAIYYYDKGILLDPEWHGSYSEKASVMFQASGDIRASIDLLHKAKKNTESQDLLNYGLAYFHYLDKDFDTALFILDKIKLVELNEQFTYFSKYQSTADINLAMGNTQLAGIYYDSARVFLEQKISEDPYEPKYHSSLGLVYARLGMNSKAIEEGLLGCELMPESLDAWVGYERLYDLSKIYAVNGDTELALEKIDYLLSIPGNFSKELLKADPVFDALRDFGEYEDILEKVY